MQARVSPLRRASGSILRFVLPVALLVGMAPSAGAGEPVNVINVHTFLGITTDGVGARGELYFDSADGAFYGTTYAGGESSFGTVYKLLPSGELSLLHSFTAVSPEGYYPYAGVTKGTDGAYYGTTYFGGANQSGTLYKITGDGTFTTLFSFNSDNRGGFFPYGGLTQASDGNFYGTTLRGGASDRGTVFKMDAAGAVTVLAEFKGADGSNPESTLIVGPDGALYGTTVQGGANDRGTVFRITTAGALTTLYSFAPLGAFNATGVAVNANGANPRAGLTLGADGNFYGTAYNGGTDGLGTVFRMTLAGELTTLHSFKGAPNEGAGPLAAVTRGVDGTLYGTTERGGSVGYGTAWRITAAGVFEHLHAFTGLTTADGATPYTSLLPHDGYLIGLTYSDTTVSAGSVYKLDLGTSGVLPVNITTSPAAIEVGAGATLTWSSPTAATCTATGAWADTIDTSGTKALAPTSAGIYTHILNCTDGAGVVRTAQTVLVVSAAAAQPVDGGAGGGGALGGLALTLLAGFAGLRVRMRWHS